MNIVEEIFEKKCNKEINQILEELLIEVRSAIVKLNVSGSFPLSDSFSEFFLQQLDKQNPNWMKEYKSFKFEHYLKEIENSGSFKHMKKEVKK